MDPATAPAYAGASARLAQDDWFLPLVGILREA